MLQFLRGTGYLSIGVSVSVHKGPQHTELGLLGCCRSGGSDKHQGLPGTAMPSQADPPVGGGQGRGVAFAVLPDFSDCPPTAHTQKTAGVPLDLPLTVGHCLPLYRDCAIWSAPQGNHVLAPMCSVP